MTTLDAPRLLAAVDTLLDELDTATPAGSPRVTLSLAPEDPEDLELGPGTASFRHLGGRYVIWKMAVEGEDVTGHVQLNPSVDGIRISFGEVDGLPAGSAELAGLEQELTAAVRAALSTMPKWSKLRALILTDHIQRKVKDLRTQLDNVRLDLEDVQQSQLWSAVAHEPDAAVARVAEELLVSTSFTGTPDELVLAARAATRD